MSLGMSYHEYWYGEPQLVKYYYEAYNYRRKEKNQELWLQGLYFAHAISSNFSKKDKYPKEPLDIYPKTAEEKRIEQENNRKKVIDYFTNLQQRWNNGNNR